MPHPPWLLSTHLKHPTVPSMHIIKPGTFLLFTALHYIPIIGSFVMATPVSNPARAAACTESGPCVVGLVECCEGYSCQPNLLLVGVCSYITNARNTLTSLSRNAHLTQTMTMTVSVPVPMTNRRWTIEKKSIVIHVCWNIGHQFRETQITIPVPFSLQAIRHLRILLGAEGLVAYLP